jgi:hypothetical protein
MATGSSSDILSRVKQLIPARWFAWTAPLRDAVLGGLSDAAAASYSFYTYAKSQSRIATAFGVQLDLIAYDFLGRYLFRNGSSDAVFKQRILATILQERVTRKGMIGALTTLTGLAPTIFEPWNPNDTGAYGVKFTGYNVAGGYGSMQLPGQVFITVPNPSTPGIPNTGGWGSKVFGYGGAIPMIGEYAGPGVSTTPYQNSDIYATINNTRPSGVICWTRIL